MSAKMLGTCLHMMKGTPYVFQGEEIGMTNFPWESVDQINDIESVGNYRQLLAAGKVTPEEGLKNLRRTTRDNARTPMQWDDTPNAGFTTGTPWLPVNPNYTCINAAESVKREDSVFHYYQKLIDLRHRMDVVVYGVYELLDAENPDIYAYTRTLDGEKLQVVCNFTDKNVAWDIPEEFKGARVLIHNRAENLEGRSDILPYEAVVLYR